MVSGNGSGNFEQILLGEFNKRFSAAMVRAALEDGLNYGLAVMKESTPVRSGALKDSEGVSVMSDTEGEMHANAGYAGYVNDGTSRHPPQPFFSRGSATAAEKIREALSKL